VPAPGEIVAAVVIGLVALLSLRLVIAVPGWVRLGRRPETRAIRVVGVGGGGSNAVDRMVLAGIRGVSFVALNTDAQALRRSTADSKIRIGDGITGGLGSGGDPETGRRAAEEDEGRIARSVTGADLVFVTAGLGGGTGSGAAPIVAANARKQGALTIAVVTKPFGFEGTQRKRIAEAAAAELGANVDALIVVPNERVSDVLPEDVAMLDAFGHVDDILLQAVQGIIDLITAPGLINLDFADIRSVMTDAGPALIGLGRGRGEHRAADAARHAIASPLLEASIEGARGLLFNVSGPADLRLREVRQAAEAIREHADPDANVIFGASFNESLGEDVLITLIATGLNKHEQVRPTRPTRAEVRPVEAEVRPVEAEVRPVEAGLRPVVEVKPAPTPASPPATHESEADPVAGPAQHIRPRSAAGADVSDPAPRRSKRAAEDDLEVPSFLRRRG
jgi:cell division protein FtsZ